MVRVLEQQLTIPFSTMRRYGAPMATSRDIWTRSSEDIDKQAQIHAWSVLASNELKLGKLPADVLPERFPNPQY